MKILEILNKLNNKMLNFSSKDVEEALAELEELQHRSCESCVHRSFLDETLTDKITNGFCMENGFFTKVGFCCNRYKAKEQ